MNSLIFKRFSYATYGSHLSWRCLVTTPRRQFNTEGSMTQVMRDYYNKDQEVLSINSITKTMSDILASQTQFEEHQKFSPFADELSYYIVKLGSSYKALHVSNQQARTLLDFGTTYDIQERDYWRLVHSTLKDKIKDFKAKEIISILSQLKQFNLWNTSLATDAVQFLKEQVQTLTTVELVLFIMVYTSSNSQAAIQTDTNFDEKLDYVLSKHVSNLTVDEFGAICNSIAYTDSDNSTYQSGVQLTLSLKDALPQVEEWLESNSFLLNALPSVVQAYSNIINTLDSHQRDSLKSKMESCIFQNAQNIKAQEAIQLVYAVYPFASHELMYLLDKIIGNNISEVPSNELITLFKCFLLSGNPRDKIILLLLKHIKKDLQQLKLSEICELANIIGNAGDIQENFFELIEPYILNKLHSLSEQDLINAIIGYNCEKLSKRFEILDILEGTLINQAEKLSFESLSLILRFYSEKRIGNSVLIQTLINQLQKVDPNNQQTDTETLLSAAISLNLCGNQQSTLTKFQERFTKEINKLSTDMVTLLDKIYSIEEYGNNDLQKAIQKKLKE